MSLTLEEVKHIANLARLELTEVELTRFCEQLSTILAHFQALQAIDTQAIPPTMSVTTAQGGLREDQPGRCLALDDLFRNAPESEAQLFRVPPIFE